MKALDMELSLASYFDSRMNVIVPNISWGIYMHECDLFILTKAGYGYEVEIKVNKYDLIHDKKKWHAHKDERISRLYFAIPTKLMSYIEHIPERAGIIEVKWVGDYKQCTLHRKPKISNNYKFSIEEQFKIARLGTMRIWNLKRKLKKLREGK